jgi:NADPH:quinone reductase-like Zn-dependent oxidoreductase
MKAAVHHRYGPPEVLQIEEVERPVPKDDEVLVRVHATTVTQTDCHMRRAQPFIWRFMLGLRRPRRTILGAEFAGVVEAVGSSVSEFKVGDEVFGARTSSHAEYVCVPESGRIAHKPAVMTFEEAAAVCDGAYQGMGAMRGGDVGPGTRLVVYGASGSCGTAAVQLAKQRGAHVTAVCNTANVELVRSLGADDVIDYLNEDFTKNGETYDVILDAVGKHSFRRCKGSLKPGGIYVATDRLVNFVLRAWTARVGNRRAVFNFTPPTKADILQLKELIEAGHYRAVVDRVYPLQEIAEASKYVESWQKTGNVVLTLDGAGPAGA